MTDLFDSSAEAGEPGTPSVEEEVVELPLLLPGWQLTKLETVASQRGMTAAEMVRVLLRDFLRIVPVQKRIRTS